MRSIILLLAIVAVAKPTRLTGQFFTPLPAPTEAKEIEQEDYFYGLTGYLRGLHHDSKYLRGKKAEAEKYVQEYCESKPEVKADCTKVLVVDSIVARGSLPPPFHRNSLAFAWPWANHDSRNHEYLVEYLRASNATTSLSVFNQFAANVSSKTAYVTTDVISGLAIGTLISIQYAAVVVKDTNQVPDRRQAVEDNTATAMRMVNNGGTVTARILYPFWSNGGTSVQQAVSFYGTAGVIGPTGNADSLRFAGSTVLELMNGIAIRSLTGADVQGELIIGLRAGLGFSEDELIPNTGRKKLPFAQLGIGLRQSGRLGLSLLYTYLGNNTVFRPFYPKFLVNFSALR
jgi:hypothetical protein